MRIAGAVCLLAVLAAPAEVYARRPDPLIELDYQIVGPGWKVWSLRLEANGKIIEERYDWSSKDYHSIKTRCKLTKTRIAEVVGAAIKDARPLPRQVNEGELVPIDGPYKRIHVQDSPRAIDSSWYSPEDESPAGEAKDFAEAWKRVEALLSCSGEQRD